MTKFEEAATLYHQKQYHFYSPFLIKITMGSSDVTVNYLELLDQSCVEHPHMHKCYEIYYCLSGEQHLFVDGEVLTLLPGYFAMLPPNTTHHTRYEPHILKSYMALTFTAPTISAARVRQGMAEENFLTQSLQYFDTHNVCVKKDKFGGKNILSRMEREFEKPSPGNFFMIGALCQEYIISILRNLDNGQFLPVESKSINLPIAITKYLHANYSKNVTIQDIAKEFHVSSRHVNRMFEEYFGESFHRTLNIYRLNYAKNYLIDTDYSIEKISGLVGFSSPKMLYQMFREMEGTTVAQYRTNIKAQPHK